MSSSKSSQTITVDKNLIFYIGKYVLLKVLVEEDIQNSGWVGWFNNRELCQENTHHYFPNTYEKQVDYLKDCHGLLLH